jgi:hypothetical protein
MYRAGIVISGFLFRVEIAHTSDYDSYLVHARDTYVSDVAFGRGRA